MQRFLRWTSNILFVFAMVCLVLGFCSYKGWLFPPAYVDELFTVDAEVKNFGVATVGSTPTVAFKFKNDSSQQLHIIGAGFG